MWGTPSPRDGRPDLSFGRLGPRCGGGRWRAQAAWPRTGESAGGRPGAEGLRAEGWLCPLRTVFWVIKSTQAGEHSSRWARLQRQPCFPARPGAGRPPRFGDTQMGLRPGSGPWPQSRGARGLSAARTAAKEARPSPRTWRKVLGGGAAGGLPARGLGVRVSREASTASCRAPPPPPAPPPRWYLCPRR